MAKTVFGKWWNADHAPSAFLLIIVLVDATTSILSNKSPSTHFRVDSERFRSAVKLSTLKTKRQLFDSLDDVIANLYLL